MSKELLRVRNGEFRICPITKINIGKEPAEPSFLTYEPKNGLAVEMRCKDETSYIVLVFIKPSKDGEVDIEPTFHFWNEVTEGNFTIVRRLVKFAEDTVELLNYAD